MKTRSMRQFAGLLRARLPELRLSTIADPRDRRGRRWRLQSLLNMLVLGLMSGRKSLREVELLSEEMSVAMRRLMGVSRRVADTTLRELACRLPIDGVRASLHRLIRQARRRKALEPVGFPFHVVAMDGKATAVPCWDPLYAQKHTPEDPSQQPYGLVRTVSSTLVSAAGRPCIDAIPIRPSTNEMGAFERAFTELVSTYGDLFRVITYDAGAASEANARVVVEHAKDYVFRVRNEQQHMWRVMSELLATKMPVTESIETLNNARQVRRRLTLMRVHDHSGLRHNTLWPHARTILRIDTEEDSRGVTTLLDSRYYASSLPPEVLTNEQWLALIRAHWGVENNCHHTLDAQFREDEKPWIEMDAQGTLAIMLLRRIACSMLSLFRAVTLRSEDMRATPWKDLMRGIYNTAIAATDQAISGLRVRMTTACG